MAPVALSSGVDMSPFLSMGKDGFGVIATVFSVLCQSSQASESSIQMLTFWLYFKPQVAINN